MMVVVVAVVVVELLTEVSVFFLLLLESSRPHLLRQEMRNTTKLESELRPSSLVWQLTYPWWESIDYSDLLEHAVL